MRLPEGVFCSESDGGSSVGIRVRVGRECRRYILVVPSSCFLSIQCPLKVRRCRLLQVDARPQDRVRQASPPAARGPSSSLLDEISGLPRGMWVLKRLCESCFSPICGNETRRLGRSDFTTSGAMVQYNLISISHCHLFQILAISSLFNMDCWRRLSEVHQVSAFEHGLNSSLPVPLATPVEQNEA